MNADKIPPRTRQRRNVGGYAKGTRSVPGAPDGTAQLWPICHPRAVAITRSSIFFNNMRRLGL